MYNKFLFRTDSNYCGEDNDSQSICSEQSNDVVSAAEINSKTKRIYNKKTSKRTHEIDEAQSILDFIKQKSNSEDEDYHLAMSLVQEIKRVPLQYKLKLKAEMNLLISKSQHLSETDSNQLNQSIRPQSSNNSHTPTYYYHRSLEQDRNVPLLTHQHQHHFYSSNYNQVLPDAFYKINLHLTTIINISLQHSQLHRY